MNEVYAVQHISLTYPAAAEAIVRVLMNESYRAHDESLTDVTKKIMDSLGFKHD